MRRIRLGTLLSLIAILAMGMSLTVYHQRATRRESQLLAALSLYRDRGQEAMIEALERPITLTYPRGAGLVDVLRDIKAKTRGGALPGGCPIYVDPVGLQEAEIRINTPIATTPPREDLPLGVHLQRVLKPLGLDSKVESGLLIITSEGAMDKPRQEDLYIMYRDVLK